MDFRITALPGKKEWAADAHGVGISGSAAHDEELHAPQKTGHDSVELQSSDEMSARRPMPLMTGKTAAAVSSPWNGVAGAQRLARHAAASMVPSGPLGAGVMNLAQDISLDRAAELMNDASVSSCSSIWEFKTGGSIASSPCLGPDGTAYVGSDDGMLYAIKDGKKLWDFETESMVVSSPSVGSDGTVYIGSNDCRVYAIKDGRKLWDYKTEGMISSSPVAGPDGTVYAGNFDSKLYAIKDGRKLWEYKTDDTILSTPSVGSDGIVYVGSNDHRLYAIKDGKKLWDFEAGDRIRSSPSVGSDGTVYVGSDDKKIYALKDGRKLWDFKTGGPVASSPCLGPDDTVYAGSYDNKLYALKKPESLQTKLSDSDKDDAVSGAADDVLMEDDWLAIGDARMKVNRDHSKEV